MIQCHCPLVSKALLASLSVTPPNATAQAEMQHLDEPGGTAV